VEDGAGVECLCLEQLEPQRVGQVPEHRQAAPEGDGMDDENVFVDESGPRERLSEAGAAPGDDLPAGLGRRVAISSARSPRAIEDSAHFASSSVFENTTLGISFIGAA
jgi:hypothetical protein